MFTFRKKYFYLAIVLFLVEVCIALFVKDQFIRPFIGDVLVVILIYCGVRAFWRIRIPTAIALVLAFAYAVEGLQYFNLVDRLGLRPYPILAIAIGSVFDWKDILAYTIGAGIIWGVERRYSSRFRGA
jgi:uncharacterized membrane protein